MVYGFHNDPCRMVTWEAPPNRPDLWDTWDVMRKEALQACEAALKAKGYIVEWGSATLSVLIPHPSGHVPRITKADRKAQRPHFASRCYPTPITPAFPGPQRIPREEADGGDGPD